MAKEKNDVPTVELKVSDLVDLPASAPKMSAAEIAARSSKVKVKKNGKTTTVEKGNTEIELANGGPSEVAATVAMLEGPEKVKKPKKAPKEPKPPALPRLRKYGRFPTAKIEAMDVPALRARVAGLPEAQRRRIFYERENPSNGKLELVPALDTKGLEMYCGVDMEGMIVNVPSNDYEIVQYSEAFSPVLEFLAEHHDTARICAGVTHNKLQAHMYVAFPDKFNYTDPTGSKFELGMIVSAGHRDRAIRFDGFGYRRACMNAYYLSQSLGHASVVHRANAKDRIAQYVNQLEFGIESLDEYMKRSRQIGLPVSEVAAWVGENYIERAVGPIVKRYEEDKELNLLGLYNAITNVMTRSGEQGLLEADGLLENLKWAEDLIRVDDGRQDEVLQEFHESLERFNTAQALAAAKAVTA